MPDANGVAVEVLLELARLADRPTYLAAANRTLTSLAGLMQQSPHSTEHLLLATADFLRTPAPQSAETREPSVTVASADATQRVGPVTIRSYVSRLSVKPGETIRPRLSGASPAARMMNAAFDMMISGQRFF